MGKHEAVIQKVSIIIPVFNEAKTVGQLLEKVFQQPLPQNLKKEMIIVESNSRDGSREIVQKFLESHSHDSLNEVHLILQENPRGKGNAAREGIQAATGDIILIQDADLEYEMSDYPTVLAPILEGHADFVLGSRHLSAGHWKIRKFEQNPVRAYVMNMGGSFFHWFFNKVYHCKLTDPTTMFKVFKTSCIERVEFESNGFNFDFELVAKLIRLGFTPMEVPVSYQSRSFEEGKKVSFWIDPFKYAAAIVKFRLKPIKRIPVNQMKEIRSHILTRKWSLQK